MHERILLCYLNYFTETCSLKWNYGNSQRFYKKYKEYRFSKKNDIFWCHAAIFAVLCARIILKFLWWARKNNYDSSDETVPYSNKKKSFIYVKITRIPIENKLHISPYIVHCKQVTLWQSEIRLTRFSPIKSEAV